MKVADLLTPDRIAVPLRAGSVGEAVEVLLERLSASGALEGMAEIDRLRGVVQGGEGGEAVRVDQLVLLVGRSEGVEEVTAAAGVSDEAFSEDGARGLLLLLTPREADNLRVHAIPALRRFFGNREHLERFLSCKTTAEVRSFREFMELDLFEKLKVEDALTPLTYRIYPDTPLDEVVDLMVRKNLHAVPIVGEKYEVLGMITAAEALRHSLPRRIVREGEGESKQKEDQPLTARDVMSRTVMCVSEDEDLVDAANLMVNKDVAQLPVVREGEIIGLVTRDRVLRTLFR